jgi:hypothetical protein
MNILSTVEVTFHSSDPDTAEMLRTIESFPTHSSERAEMEWFLFTTLAKAAGRQADRLRQLERKGERK